jgi:hypothetical protein
METIDPVPYSATDSDDEVVYTPSATVHTEHRSPSSLATGTCIEPDLPSYAASTTRAPAAVPPHANATFVIRDRQTGLVIALKDGELGLHPDEKSPSDGVYSQYEYQYQHGRGSHWHCVQNDELWLGFRSSVSKQYIGHNNDKKDNNWRFVAKADRHRGWEYFCAREHPGGGHVLLVKHYDGFRSMNVGGVEGRELVVADKGEGGTAWDFIKVG